MTNKKAKGKKKNDIEESRMSGEEAEAMEVDCTEDFHSEKDKEDWQDLLKNCGFSNGTEAPKPEPKKKKKKTNKSNDEEASTSSSNVKNVGSIEASSEFTTKKTSKKLQKKKKSIEKSVVEETSSNVKNEETTDQQSIDSSKEESNSKKKKKKNKKSTSSVPSHDNQDEVVEPSGSAESSTETSTSFTNQGNLGFCKISPPDRTFALIKQKDGNKWHDLLNELSSELIGEGPSEPLNEYWSDKMAKYASRLFQKEEEAFKALSMKSSQYAWSEKILSSTKYGGGTLKDKLNIHTLRLQESPLHHSKSLEQLIGHIDLKSRRPMSLCMDILTELFTSHLLVPGRKLRPFLQNPFRCINASTSPEKRDRLILLWLYESQLKEHYAKFLDALKEVSMDQIEQTKMDAMSRTLTLLIANPEKEAVLLERLVNKLGDPNRSVASRAIFQLSNLLDKHHPAMKIVVVKEVERLLFRNNVNPKAQYYGICFLSQIMLSNHEGDEENAIAKKLIRIYFSFFKSSIKKGEIDSKLMAGLLTGVNRAIPYTKDLLQDTEFQSHVGTLYKVVQMSSFSIGIQALSLLFQTDGDKERYFSAVYKKILDHDLINSSKQAQFFNLIFKTLKTDPEVRRVKAFVKRLLQVCALFKPHLTCGILFLISEVFKARTEFSQLFTRESSEELAFDDQEDDGEERYFDLDDEGNPNREEAAANNANGGSSWIHAQNIRRKATRKEYDPFYRNPLYAGAELSHIWELSYLTSHSHPSAALFAQNVCKQSPISYSGDPLSDFTLIRFLDRFVFRNPKKLKKQHPLSKSKRVENDTPFSLLADGGGDSVPKDEVFIYKYLKKKAEKREKEGKDDESWENDSVTSEEFDRYLDKLADFDGEHDKDDVGIDFANHVDSKKVFSKVKKVAEEEDEDSDEELEGDDEDGFLPSDDSDFNEEAFEVDEDDEEESPSKPRGSKKRKMTESEGGGLQSLLASAEEFAEMIENDEMDSGGSGAVSNKDNAGLKQLKWEKSRRDGEGFKRKRGGGASSRVPKKRTRK